MYVTHEGKVTQHEENITPRIDMILLRTKVRIKDLHENVFDSILGVQFKITSIREWYVIAKPIKAPTPDALSLLYDEYAFPSRYLHKNYFIQMN